MGQEITLYVRCVNGTSQEIIIEGYSQSHGTRYGNIEFPVYGQDEILTWDGNLIGYLGQTYAVSNGPFPGQSIIGPWSDFGPEIVKLASYLNFQVPWRPEIHIPARSNVTFATATFGTVVINQVPTHLQPGKYVIRLGLDKVHTSLGTSEHVEFSTPVEIISVQRRKTE